MVKLLKRDSLTRVQSLSIRTSAIGLSIVFSGMVVLAMGYNPIEVFVNMVVGAIGNPNRFVETILKTIPLVIASLGIMVAFKMKFWNIGGEGQILMGAFGATFIALNYGHLPKPLVLLLMMLAGVAGGAIWALIPAFFKTKFGTNETIFTLMMNYIALKWITYLQFGPWKDPRAMGFPKIASFGDSATLPSLFGIHIGLEIMIILVIVMYIFMKNTKKGFEISVVGESLETARYAGMNINRIIIFTMIISGGLCGLTGMIQVSAIEGTLALGVSSGYGYTAIITAWLANLKPGYIVITSFAFSILLQGGSYIQTALTISSSTADMIQGVILFFILGSEFFIRYKVLFSRREAVA